MWPLGDIIHSTPTVVGRPAEAYDLVYRDPTYSDFSVAQRHRRQAIYFGGNDGMLHAINGGYYYEHLQGFCCTEVNDAGVCDNPLSSGECSDDGSIPNLGEELWAYIPYNLQPHLKCLTDTEYSHKYFVDQRPRIFDAQIFPQDSDHVGGWGTILVGSMRFGGSPVNASDQNGVDNDNRIFTSAFFVLDITNPESPELLGEMTMTNDNDTNGDTYTDLNYTTSSPTLVVMKDDTNGSTEWYLVMGSGPIDLDGSNDPGEQGRLAILPMEWLTGRLTWVDGVPLSADPSYKRAFRILNDEPIGPGMEAQGGRFLVPPSVEDASFISDLITVDFDVENPGDADFGAYYKSVAVYFGTTDGTGFDQYSDGSKYWDGGGRLFRMVTKVLDSSGDEVKSRPSDWDALWSSVDNDGPVRLLLDAKAPITAAPSVGYDTSSFWVYAGTGRFYDDNDKKDIKKQRYFGKRDPVVTSSTVATTMPYSSTFECSDTVFSWAEIAWDVDNNSVDNNQTLNKDGLPGTRGLIRTDAFLVAEEETSPYLAALSRRVSHLTFGFCYDDDEDSSTEDFCEYDEGIIATLADVNSYLDIYWPDEMDLVEVDDPYILGNTTVVAAFDDLQEFIAGTGCEDTVFGSISTGLDGWYREFHDPRERNIGQAALLGGLLIYTGYRPDENICVPEGESFLYGVHYQTGTAWKEYVFGTFSNNFGETMVKDRMGLGRGVATTPSMHVGTGEYDSKAFIQTSTGEIIEIEQENLPIKNTKSGRTSWSDRKD